MATSSDSLQGKIVLITGASDGIGKAAALGIAKLGAQIVMPVRNVAKGQRVAAAITAQSGNAQIAVMRLDLASQASIRQFANEFQQRYQRLDVLINNAGGLFGEHQVTVDGFEMTFATNYLGPFLLTNLLLDRLKASAPARIIVVTSLAELTGMIDFNDLQGEQSFWGMGAYMQSKRADLLFAYALARRLKGTGVTVNAMHPGFVRSHFGTGTPGVTAQFLRAGMFIARTPAHAARTLVYLASSPKVAGVTGAYFTERHKTLSSPFSHNVATQERLWQVSEGLTQRAAGVAIDPSVKQ